MYDIALLQERGKQSADGTINILLRSRQDGAHSKGPYLLVLSFFQFVEHSIRPSKVAQFAQRYKIQFRGLDIQQRTQLIDVSITVTIQCDVRRKVKRRDRDLGRESFLSAGKIVVTVDQNARALFGKRALQTLNRDIGKTQVDGTRDMKFVVFHAAARIQDDRPRLSTHLDEICFGQPPLLTVLRGLRC